MSTFIPFSTDDRVESIDRVFSSAWSGNTNSLTIAYTSSTQASYNTPSSSAQFYLEIYHEDPTSTSDVQYTISYGHQDGSGSQNFDNNTGGNGFSATRAIYSQYRNLVFGGDETQKFTFDGHEPKGIYILNINRARYKQSLRVGNISLSISSSGGLLELTDDSVTSTGSATLRAGVGREFTLVSGSNGVRLGSNNVFVTDSGSYGKIYPDAGFIVLNADCLNHSASGQNYGGIDLGTDNTSNYNSQNNRILRNAINLGGEFILDSQENIASRYYFVRAKNNQFNYTTNDSFTDNDGVLKFDSMIDNPQTYITTVGLYNDNLDLLAVAKLSQPLPKNFTKEALIKVKLDY